MSDSFTITSQIEVSNERLLELLEHGAEYGSTYWSPTYSCAWPELANVKTDLMLEMCPYDDASAKALPITWQSAKDAMQAIASEYPKMFARLAGDYDAEDCDCLIQMAAFGKIIFG